MDPSIASMFQAFSLAMQQQQNNDRKEALATKALQAVVNKIDQFDERNISRYLRCYVHEMELNRVSEKKMVELFGLATIPEIRDHITSITDRYGNSWEVFSHALKDEYFLEDADRVTKKLFLEWIERPNKNCKQQSYYGNLKGSTLNCRRLEENTSINNLKNVSKQGYVQRCIRGDDASHTRKDCNEINNMIQQGIICWKDGKIALKDRKDLLQTNFCKGRMRALVQDYLKEHETAARESASYGARVDDEIGGSTETSEFWASVVSTMQ
uniref:Predicted protein n=1 Tax=Physcomitrium patens TaxID=3218 RepID=A9U5Y5_PHYPA